MKFNIHHERFISITVDTDWDNIESVVFRARVFRPNINEISHVFTADAHQELRFCRYSELNITRDSFFENNGWINIAYEIEIIHILTNDDKYWAKWSYPWNNNETDIQKFIQSNTSLWGSRIFGIGDSFYMLYNKSFLSNHDQYEYDYKDLRDLSNKILPIFGKSGGRIISSDFWYAKCLRDYAESSHIKQISQKNFNTSMMMGATRNRRKALKHEQMNRMRCKYKQFKHKPKHQYHRW